jgi:hypothetical protein
VFDRTNRPGMMQALGGFPTPPSAGPTMSALGDYRQGFDTWMGQQPQFTPGGGSAFFQQSMDWLHQMPQMSQRPGQGFGGPFPPFDHHGQHGGPVATPGGGANVPGTPGGPPLPPQMMPPQPNTQFPPNPGVGSSLMVPNMTPATGTYGLPSY